MPQPRFAPSYSKTRIIADGINTIASHFSTLPHPTRHNPGPAASSLNHSSLSIISHVSLLFLMSLFVAMTNNMQIINGRKKVIEGRQWLIGDKQKVNNLELFSKFAIYYLREKYI